MVQGVERRYSVRLAIPSQFSDHGAPQPQSVRLLELSPAGARVEHRAPLQAGLLCVVELPLALGRGSLTGRVVWSKLRRVERGLEGEEQRVFQSGLLWTGFTPEEFGALAAALEILRAVPKS